jgi:hypothetical protein
MKKEYFFCYSPTLHKFLHNRHKIKFICAALNENDKRKFWLYEQSDELSKGILEYKSIFKGVDEN